MLDAAQAVALVPGDVPHRGPGRGDDGDVLAGVDVHVDGLVLALAHEPLQVIPALLPLALEAGDDGHLAADHL